MKLLYFAWLRDRIGLAEEEVTPPPGTDTIDGLIDWLVGRGEGYGRAFENRDIIRTAVNQDFASGQTAVGDDDEVAFFPPITGG